MTGQYLLNKNKTATVFQAKKFLELNTAIPIYQTGPTSPSKLHKGPSLKPESRKSKSSGRTPKSKIPQTPF